MSMKPLKKSDLDKRWMAPRRDRKRVLAPEYHLIITEGIKTEPNYFEGLKSDINRNFQGRITIRIEGIGQGANTLTLLERAEKIVKSSSEEFKHVWLVYDKDDFPKSAFDNTYFRCQDLSDDSITYHALWSNECIEFWFLLHYMRLESAISRSEYFPKLTKELGTKYEKNREDIYNVLKPNLPAAITNAKSILASYNGLPPSQCTPGTTVYEIFEMLAPYLK